MNALALDTRLDALSPKVAMPFRHLLASEQLDQSLLETVLDAGDLARDHSKLLAFTIGLLHLRAQSVPVIDTVRMAKQQGRRINLGWSAKRWKAEHDRLARAETLRRLTAEENTQYDLEQFESKLPASFAGYLIRSSRRLGMEGLRQRHCVAGYHHQVMAGACAIAAVFVDHQRWTVQLIRDPNNGAVCITQIRTRRNGIPNQEVTEAIEQELACKVREPYARMHAHAQRESLYLENLQRLLPVLRDLEVKKVDVYFDGAGDSGAIDSVDFDRDNVAQTQVEIESAETRHVDSEWRQTRVVKQCTLYKAIEELTDDYLEATGVDWYNNDGGYGELNLDVEAGTVTMEVNVRFTESETEFHSVKDIETGDER